MIIQANALHLPIASGSVQTVVTSPPYWGLRSYNTPAQIWDGLSDCQHEWGDQIRVNATNHTDKRRWNHTRNGRDEEQPIEKRVAWLRTLVDQGNVCQLCGAWRGSLGLEPTPELYVQHIVEVFREIRRVLREDGTVWANWGDSYFGGNKGNSGPLRPGDKQATNIGSWDTRRRDTGTLSPTRTGGYDGLKTKDLCGIPWRVAFALQADGWVLRQEIIWEKTNPMPESVRDRCTKAHEQIFMFSKARWTGPDPRRFAHISDEDARWLALFLDTEGNICAKRAKSKVSDHFGTQICFASTSRELLEESQRIIGLGALMATRLGKNAPMFYYQLSNRQAADLLYRLYPFLIVKQRQAALGVHLQTIIAKADQERRTKKGQLRGRLRDDDYTEELIKIWATMKLLNHFGDPDVSWVPRPEYGRWDSQPYYYDAEAIKEPASSDTHARYARGRSSDHKYADGGPGDQTIARTFEHMRLGKEGPNSRMHVNRDPSHTEEQAHRRAGVHPKAAPAGSGIKANESFSAAVKDIVETRNKRSVWTIATQPYSGAHFATFPEKLVQPCILAGTSSQGCCLKCRAPLRRVLEKGLTAHDGETDSQYEAGSTAKRLAKLRQAARARGEEYMNTQKTIGWENTCECDSGETVPCLVLDPFVGSGTVIRVATRLQRKGVGCDLNFEYLSKQARKRASKVQVEIQYAAEGIQ